MPFRMKVQPVNGDGVADQPPATRQVPKSRLMRFFERPFSLKNLAGGESSSFSKGNSGEFDPSSVCLRNMVETYMEDPDGENQSHYHCNCLSGSGTDSSDEDDENSSTLIRNLKSLLRCATFSERHIMRRATEIFNNENRYMFMPENKSKLQIIADELVALGYDASVCTSSWLQTNTKACTCPAGEYNYLDVMIGGERVLIDIDFQSKFEIARPTKTYKKVSETLPKVFVGQVDRLKRVVIFVSKAAKQSMKKKGLLMPSWRRPEFVLIKWMSPHVRINQPQPQAELNGNGGGVVV